MLSKVLTRPLFARLLQSTFDDAYDFRIAGRPKEGVYSAEPKSLNDALLLAFFGYDYQRRDNTLRTERSQ